MNKTIYLLLLLLGISIYTVGQSVEDIKGNPNKYLWGEGSGITLKKADQEALAMLISQITTQVESSFTLLQDETMQNQGDDTYSQTVHSVVKTYSSATLKNTERIILGDEPDAKVFRYIDREQVIKVFIERRDKIIGFVQNAVKCESNNQIADALRYHYWALTLLKSHPNGANINFIDDMGESHLLATWIPHQINKIFADVDIKISETELEKSSTIYTLEIRYDKNLIENFDYSYWDGTDWSNLISARDGLGWVELYGIAKDAERIKIKAEYVFEGEARIDRELEDVLKRIDPVPFRNSYYTLKVPKKIAPKKAEVKPVEIKENKALAGSSNNIEYGSGLTVASVNPEIKTTETNSLYEEPEVKFTEVKNPLSYQKSMNTVMQNIKSGEFNASQELFTADAFGIYTKLINYGNARLISKPELKFIQYQDKVICRSIPMSFKFKSNNKEFIENIVFYFNEEGKIENLSFSLSKAALYDIVKRDVWSEKDRMVLVNFLEHYKTAYALKRIDYIEQIFSDDALIITGSIVKVKPNDMNNFKSNHIVKYNRQTKKEYVKNLRHMFNNKEYVNIKFEESIIRKAGKGGDIYGVQIKQNFFSSNYGDVGYLFLMVDLNNPDEPIIHVRTWQPDVKTDSNVYGLSDFN